MTDNLGGPRQIRQGLLGRCHDEQATSNPRMMGADELISSSRELDPEIVQTTNFRQRDGSREAVRANAPIRLRWKGYLVTERQGTKADNVVSAHYELIGREFPLFPDGDVEDPQVAERPTSHFT